MRQLSLSFDLDVLIFPLRKDCVGFVAFISNLASSIICTLAHTLFHQQVSGSLINLSRTQKACLEKVVKDAMIFV